MSKQDEVGALVLAGRANLGPFRDLGPASSEALVAVAGRPMLDYVLGALFSAEGVGAVRVVGPEADLGPHLSRLYQGRVALVPAEDSLMKNVLAGARAADPGRPLLVVSSDIPLLTPEAVEDFLDRCRPWTADFYYPIIRRETVQEVYPGGRRTYVTIREGTFTGGNLVLVNPRVLEACARRAEAFVAARKSPLRLLRLLGPGFVLRFLLKRLTIADLERKVSGLFGITARAVITPHAEVGMDVDRLEDLRLAERVLAGPPGPPA